MEAAVAILVACVAGLVIFIVQRAFAGVHNLRTETQMLVSGIRTDVQALTQQVGRLQGALEERSQVYQLLEKVMEQRLKDHSR